MNDQHGLLRRDFLRMAAGVAGVVAVSGGYTMIKGTPGEVSKVWRLNPAFKLKEISTDQVEISTTLGDGKKLLHRFQGIEADLFRLAANEKNIGDAVAQLALKHGLSEKECRRQINRSLQELSGSRLIYTGEKMLVKIVEVTNG